VSFSIGGDASLKSSPLMVDKSAFGKLPWLMDLFTDLNPAVSERAEETIQGERIVGSSYRKRRS
jgi:hypothetical protein